MTANVRPAIVIVAVLAVAAVFAKTEYDKAPLPLPLAAEVNAVGLRGLTKQEVNQLLTLLRRVRVQLEESDAADH